MKMLESKLVGLKELGVLPGVSHSMDRLKFEGEVDRG